MVLLTVLLVLLFIYKAPALIKAEKIRLTDRWESSRLAWKQKNYSLAYRELNINSLQLLLVRRPAQFLYWKAEALERLGKNKKALAVRKKLLKKYPLDYYAFLLAPKSGGVTPQNCTKLLSKNAKKFPMPFKTEVMAASGKTDVDSALIWAVMKRESKFNPAAISSSGAVGVMQIMPSTAEYIAKKEKIPQFDLCLPADNIMIGAYQLNNLLRQFDADIVHAVAAYNAGATNVRSWCRRVEDKANWVEDIPYPETREFVRCVIENCYVYRLQIYAKSLLKEKS